LKIMSKKPKPFDPYKPTPEEVELMRERKAYEQGWNKEETSLTLANGTVIKRREHRCNARLKDIIEGMTALKINRTWEMFWKCMKSKPGEEPLDPFVYLKETPRRSKPEDNS